jgi:hypothetical protein
VSNDGLTELLVWAYKQGFLDAAQVLTESVKTLDDAKIRAQPLAGLEALSKQPPQTTRGGRQRMIQHLPAVLIIVEYPTARYNAAAISSANTNARTRSS